MTRPDPHATLRSVLTYNGDECLLWPHARIPKGYARIRIGEAFPYVHRLACGHRHGPPPSPSHQVRHLCGRGADGCVNPRHVVWGTPAENERDKDEHGTRRHGRVLTEEQVQEMRALHGSASFHDLAEAYGVSPATVGDIVYRTTWRNVA